MNPRTRLLQVALTHLCIGYAGPLLTAHPALRPITVIGPTFPPGDAGYGTSGDAAFTADGRSVFFLSLAPNLVTNRLTTTQVQLYCRDLTQGTTRLVSEPTLGQAGTAGAVHSYDITPDGHWAVFASDGTNFTPGDTNLVTDIFLKDLVFDGTEVISVGDRGTLGNGPSSFPLISSNALFIAFESSSDNWAPRDTNQTSDVFLRNRATQTTELLSARPDGFSGNRASSLVALSADAEVVLLRSDATDLAGDAVAVPTDLYIYRRSTQRLQRLELPGGPIPTPNFRLATVNAVLSSDGRYLAFGTDVANPVKPLPYEGIWWFDLTSGSRIRASANHLTSVERNRAESAAGPVMTADGRMLAFEARSNQTSPFRIVVWTEAQGLRALPKLVGPGIQGIQLLEPNESYEPILSPDGSRLAFSTSAEVPSAGVPIGGDYRFYVRELATGKSVTPFREIGEGFETSAPVFSPDGASLCYQASAAIPGTADDNDSQDLFLAPITLDRATLVSARAPAAPARTARGIHRLNANAVSHDGRRVVFTSSSDQLASNDDNGTADVFVHDTFLGGSQLVSVAMNGRSPVGLSTSPVISGNGRYVAFVSAETNLAPGNPAGIRQVFVRDLETGRTRIASAKDGSDEGTSTTFGSGNPGLSTDGRFVIFSSFAPDLTGRSLKSSVENLYVRDQVERRTTLISRNQVIDGALVFLEGNATAPQISGDGRCIVFLGGGNSLQGRDLFIYRTDSDSVSRIWKDAGLERCWLSADSSLAVGRKVTRGVAVGGIYAIQLEEPFRGPLLLDSPRVALADEISISSNGRRVAFTSDHGLSPNHPTASKSVYVYDLDLNTLLDLGVPAGDSIADGNAGNPILSADGKTLVFSRSSSWLVPSDTNSFSDIFLRDLELGSIRRLSQTPDGMSANGDSTRPALSADGRTVVFQSGADNLTPGDYNQLLDLFYIPVQSRVPTVAATRVGTTPKPKLVLSFPTEIGLNYQVQAADSLASTRFHAVLPDLQGTGAIVTPSLPLDGTARYVRVVIVP